jgi:Na+/melibiose symporter-like transporter
MRPPAPGLAPLWIAYGVGHFGKSLMWHGSELLFAFYLTEVCGMAPLVMAGVIAAALFASGAMDLLVGHHLKARARSIQAAAAVQLAGAAGAGVTFFLFLTAGLLFRSRFELFALAIGLAFRLAYAFYDVPQNAILGLARVDEPLRTRLSSLRCACSGLASLSIAALAPLLLTNSRQGAGFAVLGASVGCIAIGSSLWFQRVARRPATVPHAVPPSGTPATEITASLRHQRGRVAPLLWLGFVIGASSVVFMKLEPFFAAYVLRTTAARGMVMVSIAGGGIAGPFFFARIAARRHPALAFRLSAMALAAGAIAFTTVGARDAFLAAAAGFVVGCGLNGLGMLLWTAVGTLAAASTTLRRAPSPTVVFGLLTFSQKTASSLGTLVIGTALDLGGTHATAAGSSSVIVLAMGIVPLAGAAICAACAGGIGRRTAAPS